MSDYNILFLSDVVGRPGRDAVSEHLPALRAKHNPLFTIINGENSAGGLGITAAIAEEFIRAGADAITLGNHAFNKREISTYLDSGKPIVRPGNMAASVPGRGMIQIQKQGIQLAVINLCGRVMCNNANHYNVCVDSCSSCGSGTDPDYALCKKACENNCMPHFSPCY